MRRFLALAALLAVVPDAQALTCTEVSGFTSWSCVVDQVNKTITLTETIPSPTVAGITLLTLDPADVLIPWFITKTVTNGSGENWSNVDTELKVGCETGCDSNQFNSCADSLPGTAFYCSSNDFDGTSFNQPNIPPRVFGSDAFSRLLIDEVANRDFIKFFDCLPTPSDCLDLGVAPDLLAPSGVDVEIFPIISFTIESFQIVQTPNFGVVLETDWGWTHRP